MYSLFYFILAAALGLYVFCDRLMRSPLGTTLAAIRDNETRAEFFGYNSANYKNPDSSASGRPWPLWRALLFATVTGVRLSHNPGVRIFHGSPDLGRSWGQRGPAGFLPRSRGVRILEAFLSDLLTYYWIMILGLFFVVCVMFFPAGFFGSLLSDRK